MNVSAADIRVFSAGRVRRLAHGEKIDPKKFGLTGELIIPTAKGCEHFIGEMSGLLSDVASRTETRADEEFSATGVRIACQEILKNSAEHGSAQGGEIYVGWSARKELMAVTIIDQGKKPFDPFVYSDEPSPERWLMAVNQSHHKGIVIVTGKGIGGRQVSEPLVDYIDWTPLTDAAGGQLGTKVRMVFKPKPKLMKAGD
ncbi:MAG: hypothetical protein PHG85_06145 [Candidatus Altiarchaeota archaeon]|nr:hypothetical protein [Candidatus Altiarchaeota archaeon]